MVGIFWLAVLVALYLWGRDHLRSRNGVRSPGEAPNTALDRRYLQLAIWVLVVGFVPAYTALCYSRSQNGLAAVLFVAAGILVTLWSIVKLRACTRMIDLLRAERQGRLVVGRLLARKLSTEFRLFHDVPTDEGVIDHVAVGPTGVFALDSTACPPVDAGSQSRPLVRFDGRKLYFPGNPEEGSAVAVTAVRREGEWLKEWIAGSAREHVAVQPALILPGWDVHVEAGDRSPQRVPVRVLSEKSLDVLETGPRSLQPTVIHHIAVLLEGRTRSRGAAVPPDSGNPGNLSAMRVAGFDTASARSREP